MKLIFMLLLGALMANFAGASPFPWLGKRFDNAKVKCENITHWKAIVDKVKAEHPKADYPELAKLITQSLLNDSTKPIIAVTEFHVNDRNVSRAIAYSEFYGTISDSLTLWRYGHAIFCQLSDASADVLEIGIILKPEKLILPNLQKSNLHKVLSNQKHLSHKMKHVVKKLMSFSNDYTDSCSKLPEIQSIIDKLDKMNITSIVEYNRLFAEEIKATIKPQQYNVAYADTLGDVVSSIVGGDGKIEDVDQVICAYHPDDRRCHGCLVNKGVLKRLFILYYKN